MDRQMIKQNGHYRTQVVAACVSTYNSSDSHIGLKNFIIKCGEIIYLAENMEGWLKIASLNYNVKICKNKQDEGN